MYNLRKTNREFRISPALHMSVKLGVAALVMLVMVACIDAFDSTPASEQRPALVAVVGVFTGQYVGGVPLYRLPSVSVIGSRKVERTEQ